MKELIFDVMLDGRFIHTFKYKFCPAFPLGETELSDYVISKLPTLRNKKFNIAFTKVI